MAGALLVLLSSAAAAAQYLQPYKMTYASADPIGARDFAVKYLGAVERKQPHDGGDGECALIKWVAFPGTNGGHGEPYQMHFVKGYHRPNGTMTIDEFEQQMAALHGSMTLYDRFIDFHVTMSAHDLDSFAAPMIQDGVPLLARHDPRSGLFSIFVELPHAIVVEIQGRKLTVLKAPEWNRCGLPTRAAVDTMALGSVLRRAPRPLPTLKPVRAVYASTAPEAAAAFMAKYFFGERVVDASALPGPGNGTCYDLQLVRWVNPEQDTPYEMSFIRSSAPEGKGITLDEYERYLRGLHTDDVGKHDKEVGYDEYMDFHVALTFQDGDPIARGLLRDEVPFFLRGQYGQYTDFFIQGPRGQIYEVLAHEQSLIKDVPSWDLCGPIKAATVESAI